MENIEKEIKLDSKTNVYFEEIDAKNK